jgi:rhomboid protease GluP
VKKLRITYNAPVVLTFALIAVIVQFLPDAVRGEWFVSYPSFKYGTRAYVGLVTHIFGHASWEHLLANFMLILLIGPILEERHGSLSLLFMILITACVEGLADTLVSEPTLGASGVAFMMIILASTANIRAGDIPLTFIAVATVYLGREIVAMISAHDNVSHFTHVVGGMAGAAFGFFGAAAPRKEKAAKPVVASTQKSLGTAATSGPPRTR